MRALMLAAVAALGMAGAADAAVIEYRYQGLPMYFSPTAESPVNDTGINVRPGHTARITIDTEAIIGSAFAWEYDGVYDEFEPFPPYILGLIWNGWEINPRSVPMTIQMAFSDSWDVADWFIEFRWDTYIPDHISPWHDQYADTSVVTGDMLYWSSRTPGKWTIVSIDGTPVPLPAAAPLMGAALAALALIGVRRRRI